MKDSFNNNKKRVALSSTYNDILKYSITCFSAHTEQKSDFNGVSVTISGLQLSEIRTFFRKFSILLRSAAR